MPAKHLMIAIDWYGPYSSKAEAASAASEWYDDGLYLAIGPHKTKKSLKYIGLSKNLGVRLTRYHHKLDHMRIEEVWLGEVVTAEPSGKKLKVTKATLDYAEWLHAYFLDLPWNNKKKTQAPFKPVTVLNRWWKTDLSTPRRNRPHPNWPNLIDHPRYNQPSRAVWFGRKQELFERFA